MITGTGLVAAQQLQQALTGEIAVPPSPPPEITAFEVPENAPTWGFEVLDCNPEVELPHIKSFIDRTSILALVAGKRALSAAGLLEPSGRPANTEIGCAYGTALGCLEAMTIFWNKVKLSNPKFAQPLPFTQGYANSPSSLLCIDYGLRGSSATFSGDRLAGIEALTFAFDQIASGGAEMILTGASDSLSSAAFNHLFATGQLSRSGKWDDGVVPGEGAAMLVLESLESAQARKARIHAEIEGVNFFPLDPQSTVAPIQIATDMRETAVFVSTPCVHPSGGWTGPLVDASMAISTRLYTGDMLSASPVLGVALAAGVLSREIVLGAEERTSATNETLRKRIPLLAKGEPGGEARFAVATGYDPCGRLGVVMMKRYE